MDLAKIVTGEFSLTRMFRCGMTKEQIIGRYFLKKMSEFVYKRFEEQRAFIDEDIPFQKVKAELENYEITDIFYSDQQLFIKLVRPGVLIGVKGNNIAAIEKHLKEEGDKVNLKIEGLKIIEDTYPLQGDLLSCLNRHLDYF